jgi:hypothetical protein
MAKDSRLDLGRYIDYTKEPFVKKKQLNFDDLFQSPASAGQYPWNPSRFTQSDLLRKMMTRKLSLNPGLNFVGQTAEEYQVFAGMPNFDRTTEYDFVNGRALTTQRPEMQPGFNELWPETYKLSPTISADKKIKNPMPRASDPDPRGFLMAAATKQVDSEVEGKTSVSQLLSKDTGSLGAPPGSSVPKRQEDKEEKK